MALFSINAIKDANAKAGQYYFSPDTMRFFRGRVMSEVFPLSDGALFVTSEQFEGMDGTRAARRYTIRRAYDNGVITTLDGFQAYASRNGALKAAKKAAASIKSKN